MPVDRPPAPGPLVKVPGTHLQGMYTKMNIVKLYTPAAIAFKCTSVSASRSPDFAFLQACGC